MRRFYYILFAVFLLGCKGMYRNVKYQFNKTEEIKIRIPKNYVFEGLQGDHELEHRYWYPDSSVIYITTFANTMNYEEIRRQNTYYNRINALNSNDTLTLKGININGLYWKDILLKSGITIGYSRIPRNRIEEFEKAILSINK